MVTKEKAGTYVQGLGRRKTAIARVRLFKAAKNSITVNGQPVDTYFKTPSTRNAATEGLLAPALAEKFEVTAIVTGGGINGQAEAVRHGIARALVEYDAELRKKVKKMGFLKRDPRAKERRKFGLKKARKSPQWSKR